MTDEAAAPPADAGGGGGGGGGGGEWALARDGFDSEMLERPIARVTRLDAPSPPAYAAVLDNLLAGAARHGFAQVVHRVQASDRASLWALAAAGFEVMDIGLTFARPASEVPQPVARDDVEVRAATDADVEAFVAGMAEVPWGSRYEADPTYTPAQVGRLRAQWLRNSHGGRAATVLVATIAGTPASFATCVLHPDRGEGDIELVGTLPAFRGRGAASHVVAHAAAWLARRAAVVTVRTQATNTVAARVYERAGFTMRSCDLTLRRVLDGAS